VTDHSIYSAGIVYLELIGDSWLLRLFVFIFVAGLQWCLRAAVWLNFKRSIEAFFSGALMDRTLAAFSVALWYLTISCYIIGLAGAVWQNGLQSTLLLEMQVAVDWLSPASSTAGDA